jgi:uncharacterized repeat protein (TIGR03803 family)
MHCKGQLPTSLFRTMFLVAIVVLIVAAAAIPAFAQNSVPPTAVQAAKMPQYASRLAHPAKRLPPPKSQVFARATKHRGPLDSSDIYDNGPTNGNTDAWSINFGFVVSDSFTIANDQTSLTGMSFGAWLFSGDTGLSVEVSITSLENGGTSYFDQTVNFTESNCVVNSYGYNICTETTSFSGPTLNAGTYWVNLQNASVPSGDPVYWDENSGVGCQGQSCPSLASENSVGSIPSEAFTVLGETTTTTTTTSIDCSYEPNRRFNIIYNFTGGDDGGGTTNITTDQSGNLYGTTWARGSNGEGTVYKLFQEGSSWLFNTLFSFTGGYNGGPPIGGVNLGPDNRLYGNAGGGLQNCNGNDCGLIFDVKPPPTACVTALCSWTEDVDYRFTGFDDQGWMFGIDQAGNLYGLECQFNCVQGEIGIVVQYTKAGGLWTKHPIYTFSGGNGGSAPYDLLVGRDGNLYGLATGGASGRGLVFKLSPSASGWTERVLYNFDQTTAYAQPNSLLQDQFGDLYGMGYKYATVQYGFEIDGIVYKLSPRTGAIEVLATLRPGTWNSEDFANLLAIDSAGNIYGTDTGFCVDGCSGDTWVQSEIFEAGAAGGIPFTMRLGEAFSVDGGAVDAHGNVYGVGSCGTYHAGTVWEISP